MVNKINRSYSQKKWVKWGLFPFFLLVLWFALTFWYIVIFDQAVLVLSYNYSPSNFTEITHERLLKGQKLSGEFVARDNNLGIVALRFKSFQRIPYAQEDSLLFKFKEKGQKDWYYQNTYRSGFTFDMPFLPFGFPVIHDSKEKTYVFELESLKGNKINGVALSSRQPFLTSKYQENKQVLLKSPKAFIDFGIKKFVNSFQTIDISFSSLVFMFPLFFYILWNLFIKKSFKNAISGLSSYLFIYFIILVILTDILFLQILNDLLFLVIAMLWLVIFKKYRLDSKYTFVVGLFILLFSPIFLQFNNNGVAQKAAAWAFIFFVTGLIQALSKIKSVESEANKGKEGK